MIKAHLREAFHESRRLASGGICCPGEQVARALLYDSMRRSASRSSAGLDTTASDLEVTNDRPIPCARIETAVADRTIASVWCACGRASSAA